MLSEEEYNTVYTVSERMKVKLLLRQLQFVLITHKINKENNLSKTNYSQYKYLDWRMYISMNGFNV